MKTYISAHFVFVKIKKSYVKCRVLGKCRVKGIKLHFVSIEVNMFKVYKFHQNLI